jgi:hypothetical protein
MWAAALNAGRSMPAADVTTGSNSPWDNAASAEDVSASLAPRAESIGAGPTIQGQGKSVFANQARAHDAVLTEKLAARSSSDLSWVLSPSSTLESLTNAVDNLLATYNDETFDA